MSSKNLIINTLLILFLLCRLPPLSPALTPEEIAQTALASTVLIVIQDSIGRSSIRQRITSLAMGRLRLTPMS